MNIHIPSHTPDGEEIKSIGIWISGGADSSLLLYLLCKQIKENHLDVHVIAQTVRRPRPTNPMYAMDVVDVIESILDINIDHRVYYPPLNYKGAEEYADGQFFRDKNRELFDSGEIQALYSGITMNPPQDVQKTFRDGISDQEHLRGEAVDNPLTTFEHQRLIIDPFRSINKQQLAKIYEEERLLESLFPVTRSCEHMTQWTGHCGECWWCDERKWAFGRLE